MQQFIHPDLIEQHYGVPLFTGYVLLLRKKLGKTEATNFFLDTGVPDSYFDIQTNYVSEKWCDIFYKKLTELPGYTVDYIYEATQLSISKQAIGYLGIVVVKYINVSTFMRHTIGFAKRLNKVDHYEIIESGKNYFSLKFKSRRNTKYIDLITLGWKNYFELAPTLRGQKPGNCEIQELDGSFIFKVKWVNSNEYNYNAYYYMLLLSWVTITLIMIMESWGNTAQVVCSIGVFIIGVSIYLMLRKKIKKLNNSEKEHIEILDKMLSNSDKKYNELIIEKKKVDRRYQESRLLNTVIQRIGLAKSSQDLIKLTIFELKNSLGYDRVIYLKAEGQKLKVTEHFGFSGKIQKLIDQYFIDLSEQTNEYFHLGNIFKRKEHILIPVTDEYLDKLSEGAKALITMAHSRSFLMCTVSSDVNSHGVIMVDYTTEKHKLNEDDLHIVKNLSIQLAIYLDQVLAMEKEFVLRKNFQKFVPGDLVEIIRKDEIKSIIPKRETVSILFSDIRGFTIKSTLVEPEIVTKALNIYFFEVNKIIYELGGLVDKFLGDGVFAVFNAFGNCKNHEYLITCAAIRIQEKMKKIREEILSGNDVTEEWANWEIGVAIHTGEVVVGLIGTNEKLEFTSIGDVVNVTSRLCEIAKVYKNPIVASPEIVKKLENKFETIELPTQTIRGHGGSITPYLIKNQILKFEKAV